MLRGIAALMVFVFHLGTLPVVGFDRWVMRGMLGVDLFFVISGFVMALSVKNLGGPSDAGDFFVRRLWRIVPLAYAMSLIHFAFGYLRHQPFDTAQIVNNLIFFPLMTSSMPFKYVLPPVWTLALEFGFYLIVAVVVASNVRWRLTCLAIGCVVAGFLLYRLMIEFAFGVAAYSLWRSGVVRGWVPLWLGLAGIALLVIGIDAPRYLSDGLPCALLLTAALGFNPSFKPALWLGNISYSLYLTHVVALDALAPIAAQFLPVAWLAAFLAISGLVLSWLVYEAIEFPLVELAKNRRRKSGNALSQLQTAIEPAPTKESA
jgi:peptidoglycan/LPS O-acetylase OafA/YrhL